MINYLKMINWRAYEEHEVEFGKGITFIMGANGSGKTSILEAISYALTGEAALFDSKTRSQLLRDPEHPGIVTLRFDVAGNSYEIQRTQNPDRAGKAYLTRLSDKKRLANTQSSVTNQIEKLLGISDDFLRRIIYMAEGDVFNFLNAPPKDALDNQIRTVLGLTQLNEFSLALNNSGKYFRARLKLYQDLKSDLERLQIRTTADLENHINVGEEAKQGLISKLETIAQELKELDQQTSLAKNFQEEIDNLQEFIYDDSENWDGFANKSFQSCLEQFQDYLKDIEYNLTGIRMALARLDGQEEAYQRILELLEPYEDSTETVPCPVCRKLLTLSERKNILEEIYHEILSLQEQRNNQTQTQNEISKSREVLQKQINTLQPIKNLIVHTKLPGIHLHLSFSEITKAVRELINKEAIKRQEHLSQERSKTNVRIRELETYQSEYFAIRKRLQDFSFDSPEELSEELIRIEVRMLSIRAASQATEITLATQQKTDMQSIYQQIAGLWSTFTGIEGWKVDIDMLGYPAVINPELGLKLDMRQLSGGEKTALLIMLHTIIAHHFSKSDFLMIDEPLEHLDPINRRSLIRFLVDAYRHQVFGQAVIATFEEALIRKYQSSEGINIIGI